MNDPIVPDTPAPAPWLEEKTPLANGKLPAVTIDDAAIVGLRYTPSYSDYVRCLIRIFLVRPGLAPFGLAFFVASAIGPTVQRSGFLHFHPAQPIIDMTRLVPLLISIVVLIFSVSIVIGLFLPAISFVYASKYARGSLETVELTREGVRYRSEVRRRDARWSEVAYIIEYAGDVFILGRTFDRDIFVPRSKFGSRESALRFRDIAIRLWKSIDGASFLPAETLAEFSPPESN